ncbi:hypothetical protein, partial [Streptomonospora sediminis]
MAIPPKDEPTGGPGEEPTPLEPVHATVAVRAAEQDVSDGPGPPGHEPGEDQETLFRKVLSPDQSEPAYRLLSRNEGEVHEPASEQGEMVAARIAPRGTLLSPDPSDEGPDFALLPGDEDGTIAVQLDGATIGIDPEADEVEIDPGDQDMRLDPDTGLLSVG